MAKKDAPTQDLHLHMYAMSQVLQRVCATAVLNITVNFALFKYVRVKQVF